MRQDIYIANGKIYLDAEHASADYPVSRLKFTYGDIAVLTLHFEAGTIAEGDSILLAIDTDHRFGQSTTSPMAEGRETVTAEDATANACTVKVVTNTQRFYDMTNGVNAPLSAFMGIYVHKASIDDESYIQTEVGTSIVQAAPVVALFSDQIVPLSPDEVYYTKPEVDAKFIANAQKGTANGVAPLNSSSKVPAANLPFASGIYTSGEYPAGIIRAASNAVFSGLSITADGQISVSYADANRIGQRTYGCAQPITPTNLNTAVTAALTDTNHITLTTAQQNTAKSMLSVYNRSITAIPAATSEYALSEGDFSHIPETAPIYTLPNVEDTSKTHTIVIVVDFANTASVAFQDTQGTTIAPLPSASTIEQGKVFAFLCTYQALLSEWVIMPIDLEGAQ